MNFGPAALEVVAVAPGVTPDTEPVRRIAAVVTAATAILMCYAPVLGGMADQWWRDEDMGHGLAVPLVIFWIVWSGRKRLTGLPIQPSVWGLVLLLIASGVHLLSVIGGGLFAGSVAFVLSAAGVVLSLGGFAYLRFWTFPFLLALFMLPKLAIVYNQATLPLQLLASRLAVAMLTAGGALVTREGTIIDAGGHRIAVAEACNGIRYLLSLGFAAVVFAYLFDSRPWMRVVLLVAAVPVAILANAIRVAASASIPALDSGAPHPIAGVVIFLFSLALLVGTRRLVSAAHARYHD